MTKLNNVVVSIIDPSRNEHICIVPLACKYRECAPLISNRCDSEEIGSGKPNSNYNLSICIAKGVRVLVIRYVPNLLGHCSAN